MTNLEIYSGDIQTQLNRLNNVAKFLSCNPKDLGIAGERLLVFLNSGISIEELRVIVTRCLEERRLLLKELQPLDYQYSPPQEEKGTLRFAAYIV